jgi:hypothetical protein
MTLSRKNTSENTRLSTLDNSSKSNPGIGALLTRGDNYASFK